MLLRGGIGFRRGGGRRGGGAGVAILIAFALIALAWALSLVIRFALSRSRELLADAGSVELTKNPDAMISALRKIEGRGELAGAPSAVMEMCIDNPREELSDLFATHPPIEQRIGAIIKFAGGHDPGPLALPDQAEPTPREAAEPAPAGPWSDPPQATQPAQPSTQAPFLPPAPGPVGASDPAGDERGPWGPHTRN
jgi:heat shock protein HtpX